MKNEALLNRSKLQNPRCRKEGVLWKPSFRQEIPRPLQHCTNTLPKFLPGPLGSSTCQTYGKTIRPPLQPREGCTSQARGFLATQPRRQPTSHISTKTSSAVTHPSPQILIASRQTSSSCRERPMCLWLLWDRRNSPLASKGTSSRVSPSG